MQGLCFNCLLPGVIFWYFFWRHSKSDIWWRQSVAVTIKPILESIWIVKPYQINILIKFSFIYYFFNRAKLKTHNCKQRQFYHPLCTWVHNPSEQLFKNKCPGGRLFFYLRNDNKKITNAMVKSGAIKMCFFKNGFGSGSSILLYFYAKLFVHFHINKIEAHKKFGVKIK